MLHDFAYLVGYGVGFAVGFCVLALVCGPFYVLFSRFDDWRVEKGYPEPLGLLAVFALIPLMGGVIGVLTALVSFAFGLSFSLFWLF